MAYLEVVVPGDPGYLGEDEPKIQPLCRECVRELPEDGSDMCAFCQVIQP